MRPHDLEAYLARHIPLARFMGIRLETWTEEGLALGAPLSPNINDKGTAFAGALASIVTLSGWALTHLLLVEAGHPANVAIADSHIEYLRPVREDLLTWCPRPAAQTCEDFLTAYAARGKARWELTAVLQATGRDAVRLRGRYAAYAGPGAQTA